MLLVKPNSRTIAPLKLVFYVYNLKHFIAYIASQFFGTDGS